MSWIHDTKHITGDTKASVHRYTGGHISSYRFDGNGSVFPTELNITNISQTNPQQFKWFHLELSEWNKNIPNIAKLLIKILCPVFKLQLQDILLLSSIGPFCRFINDKLIFRVNSSGPSRWEFRLGFAACFTKFYVVTVSQGEIPLLGAFQIGESLLSKVPDLEEIQYSMYRDEMIKVEDRLISDYVLSFLPLNYPDRRVVPRTVSDLLVYFIDRYFDRIQDLLIKLEMEIHSVERQLNVDDSGLNKQLINERSIHKMHWDLQHILQIVANGEQVFPNLKEKCASIDWLQQSNIALDELIGRHGRLKENLCFIENRVTGMQAALDSWRAEQINIKLYYLSLASLIFLPLSFVTGVFGMNVGGVPWTGQNDPEIKHGLRNVSLISVAMLSFLLFCFTFRSTGRRIAARIVRGFLRRWWRLCEHMFG